MRANPALLVAVAILAAPAARADCPAVELRYDENEAVAEKHSDTNKDCKHDEFVYFADGRPERAERDQDFDGRVDA